MSATIGTSTCFTIFFSDKDESLSGQDTLKISVLVNEDATQKAVKALHKSFGLD